MPDGGFGIMREQRYWFACAYVYAHMQICTCIQKLCGPRQSTSHIDLLYCHNASYRYHAYHAVKQRDALPWLLMNVGLHDVPEGLHVVECLRQMECNSTIPS